jgi:hypothetical protein
MEMDEPNLNLPDIKQRRLQSWLTFFGVGVAGVVTTLVTTIVNSQIQSTSLQIERVKAEREYAKSFIDYAVTQDLEKRIRFAGYLQILAKGDWPAYYKTLLDEQHKKLEELNLKQIRLQQIREQLSRQTAEGLVESVGSSKDLQLQLQTVALEINSLRRDLGDAAKSQDQLAGEPSAKVFVYYFDNDQLGAAKALREKLTLQGFCLLGLEAAKKDTPVPGTLEVRYFRAQEDRDEANLILNIIEGAFPGMKAATKYIYLGPTTNLPRQYEIWFSKNEALAKN